MLALIPAIIVSLCQYASSMYQLEKGTTSEAYEGMQATAVMASTLLDAIDTGNYQVKDGSLYKDIKAMTTCLKMLIFLMP